MRPVFTGRENNRLTRGRKRPGREEKREMEKRGNEAGMSAVKRGTIGAVAGFCVMLVLCIGCVAAGVAAPGISVVYVLAGPLYGFGLVFANWHEVMKKTKTGAVQGAAGLAIGWILSRWLKDNRWGIFGWAYFLLRVSWHLGFCWIPGIWYGIQEISEERKAAQAAGTAAPGPGMRPRPQPRPQPRPVETLSAATPAAGIHAGAKSAASIPAAATPAISCVSGVFSGAVFPVRPGEELVVGSDPARCQIVLPPDYTAPAHCCIRYNGARGCWQVRDLSGGKTFENGVRMVRSDSFQEIPRGKLLCLGQGKNSQRFRLD